MEKTREEIVRVQEEADQVDQVLYRGARSRISSSNDLYETAPDLSFKFLFRFHIINIEL